MRNQRAGGRRNSSSRNRREAFVLEEEPNKKTGLIIFIIILVIAILGSVVFAINLKIFNGEIYRTNVKYLEEVKLKITDESITDFKYEITYIKDGEKITLDGVAEKKFIVLAETEIEKEKVKFIRGLKGIEVKYEGKEIDIEGDYIKEPIYIDKEVYTDIFTSKKMNDDVKELLGNDFEKFKETIYGVMFEEYDYELDGKVFEVTLAQDKRSALIIIVKEKMYIAYYDNGKGNYYTNDEEYKNILPNKIKIWLDKWDVKI